MAGQDLQIACAVVPDAHFNCATVIEGALGHQVEPALRSRIRGGDGIIEVGRLIAAHWTVFPGTGSWSQGASARSRGIWRSDEGYILSAGVNPSMVLDLKATSANQSETALIAGAGRCISGGRDGDREKQSGSEREECFHG